MNTIEELETEFLRQQYALTAEFKKPAYIRLSCEQLAVLKADKNALQKFDLQKEVAADPKWNGLIFVRRGSLLDGKLRDSRPKLHCIDLTKVE